jgi:hypothetical protein
MRAMLATAILAGIVIAGPEGHSAEALVHDPVYGFSVALPAFPRQDDAGISITRISFGGPVHDGKAPVCNVQIQNTGGTLSEFRTHSLEQFKTMGITLDSETSRTVSGKEALLFMSTGRDVKILSLAVQVRRSTYLVTCLAPSAQFPSYEKVFRGVIDSFSID